MKHQKVHTVVDFYDGPRRGIADYNGTPHEYQCVWDDETGNWSDVFLLRPIGREIFDLAMEDWAIWQRWDKAIERGETSLDIHPALP
jgi:hypothetical protein